MQENYNFASDNLLEIPALRLRLQADAIDQPVLPWGGQSAHWRASRAANFRGTWHFYVADAKFTALRTTPEAPLATASPTLVEPNFSLDDSTPLWLGFEIIGRKRWMARYWQHHGRRILVDLYVPDKYAQHNLLGVPKGWRAYATRATDHELTRLESEHMLAMDHAHTSDPSDLTFLVYGGGRRVEAWCQRRAAEWIPAASHRDPTSTPAAKTCG